MCATARVSVTVLRASRIFPPFQDVWNSDGPHGRVGAHLCFCTYYSTAIATPERQPPVFGDAGGQQRICLNLSQLADALWAVEAVGRYNFSTLIDIVPMVLCPSYKLGRCFYVSISLRVMTSCALAVGPENQASQREGQLDDVD